MLELVLTGEAKEKQGRAMVSGSEVPRCEANTWPRYVEHGEARALRLQAKQNKEGRDYSCSDGA